MGYQLLSGSGRGTTIDKLEVSDVEVRAIELLYGKLKDASLSSKHLIPTSEKLRKILLDLDAQNAYFREWVEVLSGHLSESNAIKDLVNASYLRTLLRRNRAMQQLKARQKLSNSASTQRFMLGRRNKTSLCHEAATCTSTIRLRNEYDT